MDSKVCTKCLVPKSIDDFYLSAKGFEGRESYCKSCQCELRKIERQARKETVISAYGGKCACCGESTRVFLALDHVNNDGYKLNKLNGDTAYRDALNRDFPADYQVLCFNCNWAKHALGACPHKANTLCQHPL